MAALTISKLADRLDAFARSQWSDKSILPYIPRPVKWLLLILLLVNIKGFPLGWHLRIFRPTIYARVYHGWRDLWDSKEQRLVRLTKICPVGKSPITQETVFRTRATPDASDFNLHLSNSSYAMTFDMIRVKYVTENLPLLYPNGCWIALGGTHYVFSREIPVNAPFEIRLSAGGWDHKWVYTVARYVTYPKNTKKSKDKSSESSKQQITPTQTPGGSIAPSPARSPPPGSNWFGAPLPPGAVLHCTAVARCCFKIGRITIPPTLAMASNGLGMTPEGFAKVQELRFKDNGKSIRKLYSGGWRDVPLEERWWDKAFGGELESNGQME
ncbi:hypothetical protein M422DRAFT_29158 [Sphaerobolus stellatus SS14]|uniref:Uncharacterized protein n=1 Tax=Sphaerobolus stellatus (strain SS14) TaxID=990650 RepID=A0A0C9W3M2_SPHS4|nr:hypothetical protein M422DRAFT_29158 [Sphaerobolus stellatus SS14]